MSCQFNVFIQCVLMQDPPSRRSLFWPCGVCFSSSESRSSGKRSWHTHSQDAADDGCSQRTDQCCGSVHDLITHAESACSFPTSEVSVEPSPCCVTEVLVSSAKADLALQDTERNTALHLACSKVPHIYWGRKCFTHWPQWIISFTVKHHTVLIIMSVLLRVMRRVPCWFWRRSATGTSSTAPMLLSRRT